MTDEHALIARLRAGDEEAFALLVRTYQPRLLRLARTVVASHPVAEQVVRDTWLAVVGGVGRPEERSSFPTWLFHLLLVRARTAGDPARRVAAVPDRAADERFDASGAWSAPPVPWIERIDDRLADDKLARRVEEILATLPDPQRQVVVLHDIEGMAPADVSLLLGVTDDGQRALLDEARERIRQQLALDLEKG
jgi:RNA polymerase sigma-70 factor (ECF subfamily)